MTIETNNFALTTGIRAMLACGMALLAMPPTEAKAVGTLCGGLGEAPCCDCCDCAVSCFCGLCNCECDAGLVETAGFCYPPPPCGGDGEVCCAPGCTCDDSWSQQYFGICGPCGGSGEPYCLDGNPGECQPGLVNLAGSCSDPSFCGGAGEPVCTSGNPCDPWHMVAGPVCAACGGDGQLPCIPGLSTTPGCNYPNAIGTEGLCQFYCDPDDAVGDCDYMFTMGEPPQAWPDGIIHYTFESGINDAQKHYVRQAMDAWGSTAADLTFLPWDGAASTYLQINDITGEPSSNHADVGWAPSGMRGLFLNAFGWSDIGRPLHELGHILGLYHEQQRPDRNDYIDVICENLSEPFDSANFARYAANLWLYLHPVYDYASIMHYGQCLGSRYNGGPGCPCPGGVCNWDDYFDNYQFDDDVPSGGRVIVVRSCDESTQQMLGDWGVNGLSAIDAEEMVAIYGSGTSLYVDPTIGGGQGTVADPYTTVVQAAGAAPGAKVWIRGGDYSAHAGTYTTPAVWHAHNGLARLH